SPATSPLAAPARDAGGVGWSPGPRSCRNRCVVGAGCVQAAPVTRSESPGVTHPPAKAVRAPRGPGCETRRPPAAGPPSPRAAPHGPCFGAESPSWGMVRDLPQAPHHGTAWHGTARHGTARHGTTWHSM
ncbi:unnamed protein product, partial [Bubo scandiacus]